MNVDRWSAVFLAVIAKFKLPASSYYVHSVDCLNTYSLGQIID